MLIFEIKKKQENFIAYSWHQRKNIFWTIYDFIFLALILDSLFHLPSIVLFTVPLVVVFRMWWSTCTSANRELSSTEKKKVFFFLKREKNKLDGCKRRTRNYLYLEQHQLSFYDDQDWFYYAPGSVWCNHAP